MSCIPMLWVCAHCLLFCFFFKQKTAYEMRISDWSSDVCSSDLSVEGVSQARGELWKLNKLQMGDASFSLKGTGQWKLSGPDRGLTLKATADITDFGEYLKKMGFKNLMRGGKGSIRGQRSDGRGVGKECVST